MTTADDVRRTVRRLREFDLHGPKRVDANFVECVHVARTWAATHRNRWHHFQRGTLYGLRHHCEYDVSRGIGDKAFAVGAVLAGWEPVRDFMQPEILRFRRVAKAKA